MACAGELDVWARIRAPHAGWAKVQGMQLPPLDSVTVTAVPTGGGITARVVSGKLASVPVGALLEATVTTVSPREVTLTVQGVPLTIRPPTGLQLQPGATLVVRVPPGAPNTPTPMLELALPAPPTPTPGQSAPAAAQRVPETVARATTDQGAVASRAATPQKAEDAAPPPPAAPRLAVVDVQNRLPDGRVRVQIDGQEQVATTAEPLTTGGRYVLQVARTPAGLVLKAPPDSPALQTEVATAVLRQPAPALPAALKPLQAELTALANPPKGEPPVPVAVREAAVAVSETLRTILPNESRPPDATQLRQLVENGGLHYEAKLARLVAEPETAPDGNDPAPTANSAKPTITERPVRDAGPAPREAALPGGPATATRELAPDLKGDLLRLLQSVQDLGGAARVPAAAAALQGIESQQAANTLAQASGTPYFLQVPFPDGSDWKTLHLALEPQNQPDQPDAEHAGRFRVFMHVPLNDLGETWIDAGLAGERFRATIYLDRAAVRERVQAALPELQNELRADGFSEVLLDVRSSGELPERRRREAGAMQAGRPESTSVLDVRA